MTTRRTILILTVIFVSLTAFISSSIRLYLSGTVSSDSKDINGKIIGLYIFVKGDNKFITGDYIDSSRHYSIDFIPENQSSFDFFIAGRGIDTTFLKSFTTFDSDQMTWNIKLTSFMKGIKISETMYDDSVKIKLEHDAKFYSYYSKALFLIAGGLKTKSESDSVCIYLDKAHKLQPENADVNDWIKKKCNGK